MTKVITYRCDRKGCDNEEQESINFGSLENWTTVEKRGWAGPNVKMDYCPDCSESLVLKDG